MSRRNLTILRLAAILLAPTLLAHAQQAVTATLQGTVINAITHQPIARALVSLDQYGQAMLTDNDGRFAFADLPAGETMLSARRPGFASDDAGGTVRQVVTAGASGITLALVPQSTITGTLLLPGDDSPEGLQLQLLHREVQSGRGSWSMFRDAEATSDGHFRFSNLPAGAYLVHVGASLDPAPAQPPAGAARPRSGYVPVFYPAARDVAGAGVITVSAGQQAEVRMELSREPFYPVTIPVVNAEQARGNISFEVASDSFLGLPARFSPGDGTVRMELPIGHYLLEAQAYAPRMLTGQQEFDVNPPNPLGGTAPVRAAAITLLPANRIPVVVHTDFTHTPATHGDGTPFTVSELIRLDLQRLGNGAGTHGRRPGLQDPDGPAPDAAELTGVTPGRYWVNATTSFGYIAAITSGGVDLLADPLTVGADGSASPIEVVLRDDAASLSATLAGDLASSVQSPGPARPNIYLQLIPQSGAAVARSQGFAADGTASLGSLPPGTYLAFASTSRLELEYRNPSVLAALAGKSQSITVEPGGAAHIALDSLVDSALGSPIEPAGAP
jgi:hypothetical protein